LDGDANDLFARCQNRFGAVGRQSPSDIPVAVKELSKDGVISVQSSCFQRTLWIGCIAARSIPSKVLRNATRHAADQSHGGEIQLKANASVQPGSHSVPDQGQQQTYKIFARNYLIPRFAPRFVILLTLTTSSSLRPSCPSETCKPLLA